MSAEKVPLPQKLYTVDEFFKLLPDGKKADLIDGVIYVASPDTPLSDDLGFLIRFLIRGYTQARKLGGAVHGSRVAFELGRRRAPEPDVSYVSQARKHILSKTRGRGAPDIAVELVAEGSIDRDYIAKKQLYEAAGVQEYWIIDPLKQSCTFYRLRDGRFAPLPLDSGHLFRSEVLTGFWLDVNWLFSDPLPDEGDCLQQILASPRS